jgi:hypothetical protein
MAVLMALFGRYVDAELVGVFWQRRITIEAQQWQRRESTGEPPAHARNVQEHRDPYLVDHIGWRTEKQYVDGREQSVRRQVSRQEIRIRTVFTYEIPLWRSVRTVPVSGQSHTEVRWPEFALADGEREGRRAESYVARFSAPTGKNGASREYRKELHEASWRSLTMGATYRLELGLLGRVRNLDPSPRG